MTKITPTPTAPSARPLRADAVRNRSTLLRTAFDAFREHGVGASLDDIAKAAGVGSGTLYRHFPTRDDLVLAVIENRMAALQQLGEQLLATAAEETAPIVALEEWMSAYIDNLRTFQGLAGTLVAVQPGGGSDQCHATRGVGERLVAAAVAAGVLQPVDPEDLLDMTAAAAWVLDHTPEQAGRAERLRDLLLAGLRR